jgi:ketose-bisphosphate aldolase
MRRPETKELVRSAWDLGLALPAFNIPYLPMMEPVVRALRDCSAFGLIAVARPEWVKFESRSTRAVYDEYQKHRDDRFTRLHLDHVPVIDEDGLGVDYLGIIGEALEIGFESVMVDGSRLSLEENISATREVVKIAHARGIPVEGELGAVMGHEAGPLPPYEELFASGKGFTDPGEVGRFVRETGVDWLSVAIGNIHGAISGAAAADRKVSARLHIGRLDQIREAAGIPLVLHGGTGIEKDCVLSAIRHGIAKINVAMAIRQPYQSLRLRSHEAALQAVYDTAVRVIRDDLELTGSADRLSACRGAEGG